MVNVKGQGWPSKETSPPASPLGFLIISRSAPLVKVIIDTGIIPGIKVDVGAKDMAGHPGEKVTEGLDGLRDRLAEYAQMGVRFAKWRAVIAVGVARTRARSQPGLHRGQCTRVGSLCCAVPGSRTGPRYRAGSALMDGEHTLERCCEVTEEVLRTVFN
jgi:fructose-bisphosphate aldolase, class I